MKKIFIISAFLALVNISVYAQVGWFWQNPLPTGADLNSVDVLDTNTAVAVGRYGTILKTSDGGKNWTFMESGTYAWFESVSACGGRCRLGWNI